MANAKRQIIQQIYLVTLGNGLLHFAKCVWASAFQICRFHSLTHSFTDSLAHDQVRLKHLIRWVWCSVTFNKSLSQPASSYLLIYEMSLYDNFMPYLQQRYRLFCSIFSRHCLTILRRNKKNCITHSSFTHEYTYILLIEYKKTFEH